ncbi:MAG: Heme transporter ATP-binding protein, partial [Thermoleophilia bacterium]|nr:Heme transporter ATP-binding protein [Thermoleophilia bacterium]
MGQNRTVDSFGASGSPIAGAAGVSNGQPILELQGISKRFGDFYANKGIDFDLRAGEVHCLVGENGAGKSTLMNMLYGLLDPSEGEILLDGEPVHFANPGEAIAAGIGMV